MPIPTFVINFKNKNVIVNLKNIISWHMMPYSLVEILARFGGTYYLHAVQANSKQIYVPSKKTVSPPFIATLTRTSRNNEGYYNCSHLKKGVEPNLETSWI
jgi:hypothetical protein